MQRGAYADAYDTLRQIGRGAFGFVYLAAARTDGLLVVTKFIDKRKVLNECWVAETNETDGKRSTKKVPMEIHLLTKLDHPSIVKVCDVFENDSFYQLVMEKFGSGMDLFEFIDRQPNVDEKLISYIFRQIVSAVAYLHGLGIIHRDLKDENVILNEIFRCKLIDFGSAAYFDEDSSFSTFCGTMEYCSPEVLSGNRYRGPELEMWSLGILLYTLIFFENPFRSAQETIEADLDFPDEISDGLQNLLSWLLHPVPTLRATVEDCERHWWLTQAVDVGKYALESVLADAEEYEINPPTNLKELLIVDSDILSALTGEND